MKLTATLIWILFFTYSSVNAFVVSDTLVLVQGSVVNKENNEPIAATMTYEKLPYYDDMGIAKSSSSGHFRMHLVKSHKYNITIKANGYKTLSQELAVNEVGISLELTRDFKLEKEEGGIRRNDRAQKPHFCQGALNYIITITRRIGWTCTVAGRPS